MLYNTVLGSAVHQHELARDIHMSLGFPRGSDGKNCLQCRRPGADPQVKKIPWRRTCNPLQYSCLGNPMDRGAWWAMVHGVTKNLTL